MRSKQFTILLTELGISNIKQYCVERYTSIDTTFLSKATDYLSSGIRGERRTITGKTFAAISRLHVRYPTS